MLPNTTTCTCDPTYENQCHACWNARTAPARAHFAAWAQEEELEEPAPQGMQTQEEDPAAVVMDLTHEEEEEQATNPATKRHRE